MPETHRPYLVIPKLVEQPTWGGQYIVSTKNWGSHDELSKLKIGQSYELFSGSNLSLLETSEDPRFIGELTDRDTVELPTKPTDAFPLADLVKKSPEATLGREILEKRGPNLALLIKYTQALGNSFQVHIKDGVTHPTWKPKPESWYYFEPGLITLGVKPGIDWDRYEEAVTIIQEKLSSYGDQIKNGSLTYLSAQEKIKSLLKEYNPWQYVNTFSVAKDQLVDLSAGGLHHSWEEDSQQAPLGNVLYEIQAEALDAISTFRCFDKGKIGSDGSVRDMHIKNYFKFIDRSPEANDPQSHIREPRTIQRTNSYSLDLLLESRHYCLNKLTLPELSATYTETTTRFKHLFVKRGRVEVASSDHAITVTESHSCFIPAGVGTYTVKNLAGSSELLISY